MRLEIILWKPCLPSVKSPQFPSLDIFFWDKDSVVRTIQRPQQTEPLFGMWYFSQFNMNIDDKLRNQLL